ncbi:hypothetical protein BB561_004016 [Smittium simulii]|uniref:Uncharacterized protein n=1 Tax=Smittium simulii TaxID=133385 RepID=A0A2T9YIF2_9FUNG|nr:hypothetical protein BB561_004016 [Smittium simulii]
MNILEKQRFYQKPGPPIYLRTPIGRVATYTTYALIAVGMTSSVYGIMSLIISGKRN